MAFAQTKGSAAVQAFVRNNVKHLDQLFRESDEWAAAQTNAAEEAERDCEGWALFVTGGWGRDWIGRAKAGCSPRRGGAGAPQGAAAVIPAVLE